MTNGYIADCIDHINMQKDDNRPENLRDASRALNSSNRAAYNKLGAKHIYEDKRDGSYRVCDTQEGKCVHIGTKKTFAEAMELRDAHIPT